MNQRLFEKLKCDLGLEIIDCLDNDGINEILLNPDGKLWADSIECGMQHVGNMDSQQAYSIIYTLAGINNITVTIQNPCLETRLPFFEAMRGERFTAQIPPVVTQPSFCIRKKSTRILTLSDYAVASRLSQRRFNFIRKAIAKRRNILVCGSPGSGKTTFTNALIDEAVQFNSQHRFIILEDLAELQCSAPNAVSLLTTPTTSMNDLLRTAMRLRPDRILIGEVRGREALDMLKAWNTGCPGGICTVHANGAIEAIQRIEDLAMEAGLDSPPHSLMTQTIDVIVFVERRNSEKGFITEIIKLEGYQDGEYIFEKIS